MTTTENYVFGRVTRVEQYDHMVAEATIDIIRFCNDLSWLSMDGWLMVRGAPVMSGPAYGVRYGPNDTDVVFLNSMVRLTLTVEHHMTVE